MALEASYLTLVDICPVSMFLEAKRGIIDKNVILQSIVIEESPIFSINEINLRWSKGD